jgi:phosphatidate cytidylyltransferase
MAPSVSPKKTWEGAAGATVLVFVLALALGPVLGPFTAAEAAVLAAIAAVVAPLGDLAESLVKRDLQVKDMGSLLPGHGGVFDRIDALLMVAPAAYWFVRTVVF